MQNLCPNSLPPQSRHFDRSVKAGSPASLLAGVLAKWRNLRLSPPCEGSVSAKSALKKDLLLCKVCGSFLYFSYCSRPHVPSRRPLKQHRRSPSKSLSSLCLRSETTPATYPASSSIGWRMNILLAAFHSRRPTTTRS